MSARRKGIEDFVADIGKAIETLIKERDGRLPDAQTIAAWLNAHGYTTYRGRPWTEQSVTKFLGSAAYTGSKPAR